MSNDGVNGSASAQATASAGRHRGRSSAASVARCQHSLRLVCHVLSVIVGLSGCSALHPLQGESPNSLPAQYTAPQRSLKETIDLSLLRQDPPPEHLVDGGDVLGVYIEGVLGNAQNAPPVFIPQDVNATPSLGYPIRVDMDGTISLPMLDPIPVRGLTISQVRQVIRDAYTRGKEAVLQPGRDHIHVSLQKPRTYRVFVIREEAGNEQGNRGPAMTVNFDIDKRGTGRVVHLPAHRNDVLNALAETGGLPGLDAENVIYVLRGSTYRPPARQPPLPPWEEHHPGFVPPAPAGIPLSGRESMGSEQPIQLTGGTRPAGPRIYTAAGWIQSDPQTPAPLAPLDPPAVPFGTGAPPQHLPLQHPGPDGCLPGEMAFSHWDSTGGIVADTEFCREGGRIIRIPLKAAPGEPLPFGPEDVILQDGDIVFLENRVTEFFYTAGLLGGGQYALPRDFDLGVMDAIAIAEAEGPRLLPTAAIGGASVLNQDVSVGASKVIIQRKLPDGRRVPIEVDLYDVMQRPDQQIVIQPEDRVILRYTRVEAICAFFERYVLNGAVIGITSGLQFGD